jgi:hypothetical protein
MKPMTLLSLLVLVLCTAVSRGEDPKGAQTLMDLQSGRKENEAKRGRITPPKAADQILGKRVIYGGYFTDLFRAEKKRPLFSLRTPLDPQKDQENLSYYPGTDKVQGVTFFSIKF